MPSACNFAIVFAIARRELPARKISKKKWITQISLIFCVKIGVFIADFEEKCKKNACFSNKFTTFEKVVPLLFPLIFAKFSTFAQFIQPL
jgi:hypothetical protein